MDTFDKLRRVSKKQFVGIYRSCKEKSKEFTCLKKKNPNK